MVTVTDVANLLVNNWVQILTIINTILILVLNSEKVRRFLVKSQFNLIPYIHNENVGIYVTIIVENKKVGNLFGRTATNCKGFLWIKPTQIADKSYAQYTKGKTPLRWEETQTTTNEIAPESEGNLQSLVYYPFKGAENSQGLFAMVGHSDKEILSYIPTRLPVDIRFEITSSEKTTHKWLRNVKLPDAIWKEMKLPAFTDDC